MLASDLAEGRVAEGKSGRRGAELLAFLLSSLLILFLWSYSAHRSVAFPQINWVDFWLWVLRLRLVISVISDFRVLEQIPLPLNHIQTQGQMMTSETYV